MNLIFLLNAIALTFTHEDQFRFERAQIPFFVQGLSRERNPQLAIEDSEEGEEETWSEP